jgi:hypothetical protein
MVSRKLFSENFTYLTFSEGAEQMRHIVLNAIIDVKNICSEIEAYLGRMKN